MHTENLLLADDDRPPEDRFELISQLGMLLPVHQAMHSQATHECPNHWASSKCPCTCIMCRRSGLCWSQQGSGARTLHCCRTGRGSYGSVHKARSVDTNEIVAVKIIPLGDQDEISDIQKEIEMLQACDHQNIVQYQVRRVCTLTPTDDISLFILRMAFFLKQPSCASLDAAGTCKHNAACL